MICVDSELDGGCKAVGAVWTGQRYYECDVAVLAPMQELAITDVTGGGSVGLMDRDIDS